MNTSLNLSFKTILKIFSVKNVIEGISLLLFIFYVFSLNVDGCLLILINSMITAKLISYLNASLDSYQFTSVFFKKLKCYIQILNYIFNNYLTIKGVWPLISLIYFLFFHDPYFLTPIVLASIIILIYINYINIKFKDNYPLLYIFINFFVYLYINFFYY